MLINVITSGVCYVDVIYVFNERSQNAGPP